MRSDAPAEHERPGIRRVLFVCAQGAAKSVFAGSYFNALAEREGLNARAVARGTEPDAEIAERVRADADATGISLCTERPVRLTPDDITSADMVVAFDLTAGELGTRSPHQAWDGIPSLKREFEPGKAAIMARVEALVAELTARGVA